MCQSVACEAHPNSRLTERAEETQAKIDRAYAPTLPPDDALRRAVVAEMRHTNAAQPIPNPVCRDCGYPFEEDGMDALFTHYCLTCGIQRLEKIVKRIRRRLGRKATVKALKRLARGK